MLAACLSLLQHSVHQHAGFADQLVVLLEHFSKACYRVPDREPQTSNPKAPNSSELPLGCAVGLLHVAVWVVHVKCDCAFAMCYVALLYVGLKPHGWHLWCRTPP